MRPADGQVDDLIGEIRACVEKNQRVLVTTLTKRMAENLTGYLRELDIKVEYLHSDVETLERVRLIRSLRLGEFHVLVGINLLREGLDMPEVALVAILDADKEGFLRSETSLVQTIGRAARNVDGRVIMYANDITDSMRKAIDETNRRREIQQQYNQEHGITPQTVRTAVRELMEVSRAPGETGAPEMDETERQMAIDRLEEQMLAAAGNLDFEKAARLRDELLALKGEKPMASAEPGMEWNGMEWNGMEWNGMEWNGMEWNGMEWNGMEWNGMEWNGMEWNGMEWNGMEWNGMEWNGMEWNGMEWNGMEWNGMEWNGMEWNGMEWNGMEWNGMEWNGMEWNGMEWTENRRKSTKRRRA